MKNIYKKWVLLMIVALIMKEGVSQLANPAALHI
jgi:hypothetical protein